MKELCNVDISQLIESSYVNGLVEKRIPTTMNDNYFIRNDRLLKIGRVKPKFIVILQESLFLFEMYNVYSISDENEYLSLMNEYEKKYENQ